MVEVRTRHDRGGSDSGKTQKQFKRNFFVGIFYNSFFLIGLKSLIF